MDHSKKPSTQTKNSKTDGGKQPNSYMVFALEMTPILKQENPDLNAMDIGWQKMECTNSKRKTRI